ncbi:MAG: esterase [Pseudohongiella sp.]|nr:MAG: esterase [Pseudohongiella sp.]
MSTVATPMNGLFDAEFFDIDSQEVGATFRIFVGKPAAIDPAAAYPVIFALDGNIAFSSLLGTQRMLTQGGEVPASFVFGIGYSGSTLMEAMSYRNRDYVPTEPEENEVRALGGNVSCGGAAFLKFLQHELKPLLAEKYPVNMADSTVQGISLGGLFASWVLLTQPRTFKRYILGSPALWWRDEQVWEWEQEYQANNDDLDAVVFVSAGELETAEHVRTDAVTIAKKTPALKGYIESMIDWSDEHGWPEIAKLTPVLVDRLNGRNYPSLKILCHNMPDENHMSAPPAMTSRGLRYVNGSWTG